MLKIKFKVPHWHLLPYMLTEIVGYEVISFSSYKHTFADCVPTVCRLCADRSAARPSLADCVDALNTHVIPTHRHKLL